MHVRPPRPSLAALVAAALLLGVSACGTDPAPTPLTPPAAAPPAYAPTALVYGEASSPVLDALTGHVRFAQHTGSERPEDHDLVVVDGHTHGPSKLRQDAFVAAAVRSGTWVLAVDVDHEHKRDGLGHLLDFATHGGSPGYFVRKQFDEHGRPKVWVVSHPVELAAGESRDVSPEAAREPGSGSAIPRAAKSTVAPGAPATEAFVEAVMDKLETGELEAQAEGPDFPDDLFHATFHFTDQLTFEAPESQKGGGGVTQTGTLNVDHTVYVAAGQLLIETDGVADPTGGSGRFANMAADEKAWGLSQLSFDIELDTAGLGSVWIQPNPQRFSPYNDASGVSGALSAPVANFDYELPGGGRGQFAYRNPQVRDLTDWELKLDRWPSRARKLPWVFQTQSPYDLDNPTPEGGWNADGTPKPLNKLQLGPFAFHVSSQWTAFDSRVKNPWRSFNHTYKLGLISMYCGDLNGQPCKTKEANEWGFTKNMNWSVNLGASVPSDAKKIYVFPFGVFRAGDVKLLTVELEAVAQSDVVFRLSTDSPNVHLPDTLLVPAGSALNSVPLVTTPSGGASGTVFKPTITVDGIYSHDYTFTVTNP